jgi:predicted MFS family arabinose efflux permease
VIGLLRERDFRLFWIGETTSAVGTSATALAMPLVAVSTLRASAFEVSLLSAATWLPWLLIALPAGAWVDRMRRRPVLLAANLTAALALLSAPVAASVGLLSLAQLLAVALVVGATAVFAQTAYQVYLPSLVTPEQMHEGNAKLQGSAAAAQLAGPGVAGLLAKLGGPVTALVADAASYLVSVGCLLGIRRTEPEPGRPAEREPLRAAIGAGLSFVRRDPYLRVIVVFGALSNLALTAFQAIVVVFMIRTVGVGAGTIGLLFMLSGVGGVLGAAVSVPLARRVGSAYAMIGSELVAGVLVLAIPLTSPGPGLVWFALGDLGVAAGVVSGNVLQGTFRQRYCPPELLGRVTASMRAVNYSTMPLAAVAAGGLATLIGLRPTIWVGAAGVLAAGTVLLTGPLKRNRDLPELVPA